MIKLKERLGPIFCVNCKQMVYYGEEQEQQYRSGFFMKTTTRDYGSSLVCEQCGRPDGLRPAGVNIPNPTEPPERVKRPKNAFRMAIGKIRCNGCSDVIRVLIKVNVT